MIFLPFNTASGREGDPFKILKAGQKKKLDES